VQLQQLAYTKYGDLSAMSEEMIDQGTNDIHHHFDTISTVVLALSLNLSLSLASLF